MDTNPDCLFSDDVQVLRFEIVRLRSLLDSDWQIREALRIRCEHLETIIQSLISRDYGKN